MRRRYIYFLLTYFLNSSKKEHIKKYSIKSTINSTEAANLPGPSSDPSCFSETGQQSREIQVRLSDQRLYLLYTYSSF